MGVLLFCRRSTQKQIWLELKGPQEAAEDAIFIHMKLSFLDFDES